MKVLSLFDGISCARLALERAGIPVERYYASEVDKYAIKISKKNFPEIVQVGDVKELLVSNNFKGVELSFCTEERGACSHTIGSIDLLIGGSPCQDLSIAKKNRKGLWGERSGLFWEYVRILDEVKPKYFILENVASMSKYDRQVITDILKVEPIMINASLVSAQRRKRLFWTNIPNITQPKDRGIILKDILESDVGEAGRIIGRKINERGVRDDYNKEIKSQQRFELNEDPQKTNTLSTVEKDNVIYLGHINETNGQANRVYTVNGKSVTLSAMSGGLGAKTGIYKIGENLRTLTPIECERLQGLPDNYTDCVSKTQRLKACGNAFNVDVVAHILSFIPVDK